ncbi:endoribonuclease YBEY, chloroplastic isoform X2 [Rhododendron vialii]|uniref:endoribonuclease YBEY, chloroplastic isoform X2 n=1 Tax=Rhododendron vialii TaxID=182163 RepID=UPI00265EA997|nr:endoribonuclease YBEY, chloroplastic isoform X2 [Rhododendron vialii]
MLPRFSPLLRTLHPHFPADPMAARAVSRSLSSPITAYFRHSSYSTLLPSPIRLCASPLCLDSSVFGWRLSDSRREDPSVPRGLFEKLFAAERGYRKVPRGRRKPARRKRKELELIVDICIEEQLPDDSEISGIAEILRLNAPMAMKLALGRLKDLKSKTRDLAIDDVGCFESVELSLVLCNDEFIRQLNKEWRDEDHATDVLSMSQHVPELKIPILMLGDVVISVETAARQAEERGHSLVDEIRILMVHGLLHLLGFDHEISDEAEAEMEEEEELLLKTLGWKGKGLIRSAYDADTHGTTHLDNTDDRKKQGSLRFYKPKFSYIFCDMDGTLLNSQSQITSTTAQALREASSRGLKVVIATGKTRAAAISVLKMVDLAGIDGIISEFCPGVFVQGLLVYGRQGREIFRSNLDPSLCREAFTYSLKHEIPLIAFSEDSCLTLFGHPLVDTLHTLNHEPKAQIMPSIEHLLAGIDIQKLIFLDTAEGVATALRPFWAEATKDRATVVQAVPDVLEIVPSGTSKGNGVRMLLDHLGASPEEIMAIGDGENDVEMLELASLGIALSNGSDKAKAVANVIGVSNDEDGVADAIYRYAF